MSRKNTFIPVALLIVGICGCGDESTNATHTAGEVDIGLMTHITGSLKGGGYDVKQGVELAVDIINNEYDLALPMAVTAGLTNINGDTIKLVIRDDQSDGTVAAAQVENLINIDGVVAVIGSYGSAITEPASEAAENLGIPFLCPVSTAHSLGQRNFEWFFRTTPELNVFAENYFHFFADISTWGHDFDSIAILSVNNMWGNQFADVINTLALDNGYTVVADISYEFETGTLDTEVGQLMAAGDVVLMQASYLPGALLSVQTYKAMDYAPIAIVTYGGGFVDGGFVDSLGADTENVLSRGDWALDLAAAKPIINDVNALFNAKFGENMNSNAARAFTGMIVLAEAINRAGSTSPEAIRQALLATDFSEAETIMPWEGVQFDAATHENVLARSIIVQIQGGEYKTVWPSAYASADLVWPYPAW